MKERVPSHDDFAWISRELQTEHLNLEALCSLLQAFCRQHWEDQVWCEHENRHYQIPSSEQ